MSDLSIRSFSGANPATVAPRTAPPESPAVQQAVAQPLTNPQSAVTQSPDVASPQWQNQRNGDASVQQQQESTARQQPGATPNRERLTETVNYLNQFLQRFDTALQFDIDDQYGEMVVRIVDRESKEVIRQMPSEETLAFARFFKELEEGGQNVLESSQGLPVSDSQRLKVEGLLLDTTV